MIRHVAILSVKGTDFKIEKIALKTVRPYIFNTIDLSDSGIQPELEDDVMSYVSDQVSSVVVIVMVVMVTMLQVKELIARVPIDFPESNKLPLIRLRVSY